MKRVAAILACLVLTGVILAAQDTTPSAPPAKSADDYSGMYSFFKEGEFIQLTVEEDGHVTGFLSRYGDQEGDKGAFLNQFFKEAKLDGNKLTFTTQTVHNVHYEFKGSVERGAGKSSGDEGYYLLKGTLTELTTDDKNKTSSHPHEVAFKSFPRNLENDPPAPKP